MGCAEKGHVIESLLGRLYGLASGAYRLMNFGRYDEALLLIRAIGEITNLLTMFSIDVSKLEEWLKEGKDIHSRNFTPVKVRIFLEEKNVQIPMDENRYKHLSRLTAHPTPSIRPGVHNPNNLSILGGHAQFMGVGVVLHELAYILGYSAIVSVKLLEIPLEIKDKIRSLGEFLLSKSVLFTPEEITEFYAKLAKKKKVEST